MGKRLQKGEIATLVTIGALIVLGISTVVSSVFLSKKENKQTTASKADEYCDEHPEAPRCQPDWKPPEEAIKNQESLPAAPQPNSNKDPNAECINGSNGYGEPCGSVPVPEPTKSSAPEPSKPSEQPKPQPP